MIISCLSDQNEFLVYGFYITPTIVATPWVNDTLYLNATKLVPIKKSIRHAYILWDAPSVKLELVFEQNVQANNQTASIMDIETQLIGWVYTSNGSIKLSTDMEDADPRWHGYPVMVDNVVIGMCMYVQYNKSPIITPIDVICMSSMSMVWMYPVLDLQFKDEHTSWKSTSICNIFFRTCDVEFEKGNLVTVVDDAGTQYSIQARPVPELTLKYEYSPLLEWGGNIYIENQQGRILCIYRNNPYQLEQKLPTSSAWLVSINGTSTYMFDQLCEYVNTAPNVNVFMWSDGTHERWDVPPNKNIYIVWQNKSRVRLEDYCEMEYPA